MTRMQHRRASHSFHWCCCEPFLSIVASVLPHGRVYSSLMSSRFRRELLGLCCKHAGDGPVDIIDLHNSKLCFALYCHRVICIYLHVFPRCSRCRCLVGMVSGCGSWVFFSILHFLFIIIFLFLLFPFVIFLEHFHCCSCISGLSTRKEVRVSDLHEISISILVPSRSLVAATCSHLCFALHTFASLVALALWVHRHLIQQSHTHIYIYIHTCIDRRGTRHIE